MGIEGRSELNYGQLRPIIPLYNRNKDIFQTIETCFVEHGSQNCCHLQQRKPQLFTSANYCCSLISQNLHLAFCCTSSFLQHLALQHVQHFTFGRLVLFFRFHPIARVFLQVVLASKKASRVFLR